MRHPKLRKIARILGVALLCLFGLVVSLIATGILVANTGWGQKKLLALALPALNKPLLGRVEIGGLGGNLISRLSLRDIRLYDGEAELAARVEELALHYNLLALIRRDVHITNADLKNAEVRLRFLRDANLNLASLLKPTPPSGPLPVTIRIDDVTVNLGATFEPQPGSAVPPARVQLHLQAAARIADPHITADLSALRISSQAPLAADIDLAGGVSVVKGAQPQIAARNLRLSLRTSGEEATRLLPQAALRGPLQLEMAFSGPLTALGVEGTARLPKGTLRLHGNVGALDPKLPWQIQIDAQDIDPHAARADIPEASIVLAADGQGQFLDGRINLHKLEVRSLGTTVVASGFAQGNAQTSLRFPLAPELAAQLMVQVNAPDLRKLTEPFVAPSLKLGGAIRLDAKASAEKGQLRIDLNTDAAHLKAAQNSIEKLTLALHSADFLGQLKLHADSVNSPLRLTRLDLDAQMTEQALSVQARGMDVKKLVFDFAVAGRPRMAQQKLLSLQASLNKLFLSRAGQRLDLIAPAAIAVDMQHPDGPIIDLGQVALRLQNQQVTLAGHFAAKPQRFSASVHALGINAKQWAQLAGASGIPGTSLDLHVQAQGTPKAPQGTLQLGGSIDALPEQHLPRSNLRIAVTLHEKRAQGDLSIQFSQANSAASSGEPPRASLHFAAPLTRSGPLTVDLQAQTSAQPWSELLPAQVRSLRGLIQLQATLRGTLARPELALSLKAPSWALDKLRGWESGVALTYGNELLSLRLDSKLATAPVAHVATTMLRAQTRIKLGLEPHQMPTAAEFQRQLLSGAMEVDASVLHIDLPKVLEMIAPPEKTDSALLSGTLGATVHIEGTPAAPLVKLNVDAKDLAVDVPNLQNLSVEVAANYAGQDLKVDISAGLPKQPLLTAHAQTVLPMQTILAGAVVSKQLPLQVHAEVLPFELSQISKVHGQLIAQANVKGTVGTPELTAWVRSQRVQIENFAVGPLAINANLDARRQFQADVSVQQKDGRLRLLAQSPVPPRLDAVKLNLTAQNFHVDYDPTPGKIRLKDPLGMLRGVLNADLQMQGHGAGPRVSGFLKLEKGGLMMKALQQALSDIYIDLQIVPPNAGENRTVVALRQAKLKTDTGSAAASAYVELDGMKLSKLNASASAQQFPIWAGIMGLWIDSKVNVNGRVDGDTLRVDVNIPEGGVRLPKFQSARSVQPLGPFEDVTLIDLQAQQAAARAQKKAEDKEKQAAQRQAAGESFALLPRHTRVAVQLPPAFHISGPELRSDLTGHITMTLDRGGLPRITGQVRNSQGFGWVEILKRRYEIERIEASLPGDVPPNPLFNIEISRKLNEATIYITVTGSAKKPKISFRSEPPVLDESQIIAVILMGERSGAGDTQAMGILSSLLIGQLRDQLADRLPIDVLRVDVAGDDPMGVNQSSLEVGKYLRDNVYLGYKRRFGSATTGLRRMNADEVILEYNFFQNYKVKTLYGDANVGAIDLYWNKRF